MTPRPLYKWKSFWLGILVLGFLGWAWAHLLAQSYDYTVFHDDHRVTSLEGDSGGFRIYSAQMVEGNGPIPARSLPFVEIPTWAFLPKPLGRGATCWIAFSLWFPVLFFVVPWLGFLFWRVRKQLKHTA